MKRSVVTTGSSRVVNGWGTPVNYFPPHPGNGKPFFPFGKNRIFDKKTGAAGFIFGNVQITQTAKAVLHIKVR